MRSMNFAIRASEFDVPVVVNSHIAGSDAALRGNAGCLDENQSSPAHSPAAEMDQVPVIGKSIDRRILAHGRNHDPVAESDAADS